MTKIKLIEEIDKYFAEFEVAENEDWFEWIQDTNDLLYKSLQQMKKDEVKLFKLTK